MKSRTKIVISLGVAAVAFVGTYLFLQDIAEASGRWAISGMVAAVTGLVTGVLLGVGLDPRSTVTDGDAPGSIQPHNDDWDRHRHSHGQDPKEFRYRSGGDQSSGENRFRGNH